RQGGAARRPAAATGPGSGGRPCPRGAGIRLDPKPLRRHGPGHRLQRRPWRLRRRAARRSPLRRHGDLTVTSHAYAYELATSRLPVFSQAAATSGKIVCNVWAPEWLGGPGAFETESDPHLALFHSMDRCFAAIAAWNWRAMQRQAARGAWWRISDAGAKPAME